MAGIYIHIPFCRQACHYCDFHFAAGKRDYGAMIEAIRKEAALRKDYLHGETIDTVYFGGGTPSLLAAEEVTNILEAIREFHTIAADAEITLEANPDNIEEVGKLESWKVGKLQEWKKAGVNRLSIGIQSFSDDDLRFMNRTHNAQTARRSVEAAREAGIENITIDLIYGSPTTDDAQWERNLETALTLDVAHLSCYALTVEPKTALAHFIRKGKSRPVDEEQSARQFRTLMKVMREAGYEHYEISNFCRPGRHSRHNTSYWKGEKYIGLGPSAHSYDGISRQWNVSNNAAYILSIGKGVIPAEAETLTATDRYNEYIMTSLRTMWGCDTERVKRDSGEQFYEHLVREAGRIRREWLNSTNGVLTLTDEGKLFADHIAAGFFL